MKIFGLRIARDTSLEADVAVLLIETEGLHDRVAQLEQDFRILANDIRVLKLKVK